MRATPDASVGCAESVSPTAILSPRRRHERRPQVFKRRSSASAIGHAAASPASSTKVTMSPMILVRLKSLGV